MIVFNSSFFSILEMLAFSVFSTFPRRGRMAWNLRSRPCLAEPPAESPSTRYNSFLRASRDCALASFPERIFSLFPFVFPLRASSLALRAASLAMLARCIFLTSVVASSLFSSKKKLNFSLTIASTAFFASGVPSFPFVCPSNCKSSSGIPKDKIIVSPSRTSLPSKFLSLSFNKPFLLAKSLNTFVKAFLAPVSWVPPSLVRTILTKEKIFS